jgi:hypothetical protein
MFAYDSKSSALRDYFFGHTSARRIFRAITTLEIEDLKHWLKNGNLKVPISGTGYGRRPYVTPIWWKYFR